MTPQLVLPRQQRTLEQEKLLQYVTLYTYPIQSRLLPEHITSPIRINLLMEISHRMKHLKRQQQKFEYLVATQHHWEVDELTVNVSINSDSPNLDFIHVNVKTKHGSDNNHEALLDSGAEGSLITENLVQKL